jgi:oligopeptide/dipeptide ABC transporter ATP-binding protein
MLETLLEIRDLKTYFHTPRGILKAVDGISLRIRQSAKVGLVGESGCGKSVAARSILRLIREPGRIVGGQVLFNGEDMLRMPERQLRSIRGRSIAMVFQDPSAAMNPLLTIGDQVSEPLRMHQDLPTQTILIQELLGSIGGATASKAQGFFPATLDALKSARFPDAENRLFAYPHQLSGGMQQRAIIGMSLICRPALLIADEPTTALDVTVQAQIMALLRHLQEEHSTSVLLISHDLGLIGEFCDEVAVMYCGRIVEHAPAASLFSRPLHPYTQGLLASLPQLEKQQEWLPSIPGVVPEPIDLPETCHFLTRCSKALPICSKAEPPLYQEEDHKVKCHLYREGHKDASIKS